MTTGHSRQAYRYIRSIEGSLRKLENLVRDIEAQTPAMRPQDARSEILEQVHVAGAMEQRQLFQLLDQRSISHTWIGIPGGRGVSGHVARRRRTNLLPSHRTGHPGATSGPVSHHHRRLPFQFAFRRRLAEREGTRSMTVL